MPKSDENASGDDCEAQRATGQEATQQQPPRDSDTFFRDAMQKLRGVVDPDTPSLTVSTRTARNPGRLQLTEGRFRGFEQKLVRRKSKDEIPERVFKKTAAWIDLGQNTNESAMEGLFGALKRDGTMDVFIFDSFECGEQNGRNPGMYSTQDRLRYAKNDQCEVKRFGLLRGLDTNDFQLIERVTAFDLFVRKEWGRAYNYFVESLGRVKAQDPSSEDSLDLYASLYFELYSLLSKIVEIILSNDTDVAETIKRLINGFSEQKDHLISSMNALPSVDKAKKDGLIGAINQDFNSFNISKSPDEEKEYLSSVSTQKEAQEWPDRQDWFRNLDLLGLCGDRFQRNGTLTDRISTDFMSKTLLFAYLLKNQKDSYTHITYFGNDEGCIKAAEAVHHALQSPVNLRCVHVMEGLTQAPPPAQPPDPDSHPPEPADTVEVSESGLMPDEEPHSPEGDTARSSFLPLVDSDAPSDDEEAAGDGEADRIEPNPELHEEQPTMKPENQPDPARSPAGHNEDAPPSGELSPATDDTPSSAPQPQPLSPPAAPAPPPPPPSPSSSRGDRPTVSHQDLLKGIRKKADEEAQKRAQQAEREQKAKEASGGTLDTPACAPKPPPKAPDPYMEAIQAQRGKVLSGGAAKKTPPPAEKSAPPLSEAQAKLEEMRRRAAAGNNQAGGVTANSPGATSGDLQPESGQGPGGASPRAPSPVAASGQGSGQRLPATRPQQPVKKKTPVGSPAPSPQARRTTANVGGARRVPAPQGQLPPSRPPQPSQGVGQPGQGSEALALAARPKPQSEASVQNQQALESRLAEYEAQLAESEKTRAGLDSKIVSLSEENKQLNAAQRASEEAHKAELDKIRRENSGNEASAAKAKSEIDRLTAEMSLLSEAKEELANGNSRLTKENQAQLAELRHEIEQTRARAAKAEEAAAQANSTIREQRDDLDESKEKMSRLDAERTSLFEQNKQLTEGHRASEEAHKAELDKIRRESSGNEASAAKAKSEIDRLTAEVSVLSEAKEELADGKSRLTEEHQGELSTLRQEIEQSEARAAKAEEASAQANSTIREQRGDLAESKERMSRLDAEREKMIVENKQLIEGHRASEEAHQAELDKIGQASRGHEASAAEAKSTIDRLTAEMSLLSEAKEELANEKSRLEEEHRDELAKLQQEIEQFRARAVKADEDAAKSDDTIRDQVDSLAELQRKLEQTTLGNGALTERVVAYESQVREQALENQEAEEKSTKSTKLLGEKDQAIQALEKQSEELKAQLVENQALTERLSAKNSKLTARNSELQAKNEHLRDSHGPGRAESSPAPRPAGESMEPEGEDIVLHPDDPHAPSRSEGSEGKQEQSDSEVKIRKALKAYITTLVNVGSFIPDAKRSLVAKKVVDQDKHRLAKWDLAEFKAIKAKLKREVGEKDQKALNELLNEIEAKQALLAIEASIECKLNGTEGKWETASFGGSRLYDHGFEGVVQGVKVPFGVARILDDIHAVRKETYGYKGARDQVERHVRDSSKKPARWYNFFKGRDASTQKFYEDCNRDLKKPAEEPSESLSIKNILYGLICCR